MFKHFLKVAGLLLAAACAASLSGCKGGPGDSATAAKVSDIAPAVSCSALATAALSPYSVVIKSASERTYAARSTAPAGSYCQVTGIVDPRTGVTNPTSGSNRYGDMFELQLPDRWSGRFLYQGGGGMDGVVVIAPRESNSTTYYVSRGFAVVASDAGHEGATPFDAGFGFDPQARIDYGYASIGAVTPVAKALIQAYYGKAPKYSYFVGASKGGNEALQAAQRYGDQFDGVVAGDPGLQLSKAAVAEAWNDQIFGQAAAAVTPGAVDASGNPLLWDSFSASDLTRVSHYIQSKCDALDGLTDHMIFNTAACAKQTFDFATLQCRGAKHAGCLIPAQVTTLDKFFAGVKGSAGRPLYASFPHDIDIMSPGWTIWMIGHHPGGGAARANNAINALIAPAAEGEIFAFPPQQHLNLFTASVDQLAKKNASSGIDPASGVHYPVPSDDFMAADSTDYAKLRAHHGKLIIYQGMSDPVFSANNLISYYTSVNAAYGGKAAGFARLFLVPGMNHVSGGDYTVDRFDYLGAIETWVEHGVAPDYMVGTPLTPAANHLPANLTRPICAYPDYARYNGSGDTNRYTSFTCTNASKHGATSGAGNSVP